jgi:hypothetical protein
MTADHTEKTTLGSDAPGSSSLDPRTQRAVLRIRQALGRKNGSEAVRFFKEAVAHGLIREDENVLVWLRQTMGSDATEKLLAAYAGLPCFYCNKGFVPCEECKGRGYDASQKLCVECLALGIDRCSFCGGSGWFTINYVPSAFRLRVMARRVTAAGKEAETLLADPKAAASSDNPREARKVAAKELLQANRLLSVLENMKLAATQEESRRPESREVAEKIVAACAKLSPRLSERVHGLLTMLAETATLEAGAATRASSRRMAEERAEFYRRALSFKDSTAALLRHPFLFPDHSSTTPPDKPSDETNGSETMTTPGNG